MSPMWLEPAVSARTGGIANGRIAWVRYTSLVRSRPGCHEKIQPLPVVIMPCVLVSEPGGRRHESTEVGCHDSAHGPSATARPDAGGNVRRGITATVQQS